MKHYVFCYLDYLISYLFSFCPLFISCSTDGVVFRHSVVVAACVVSHETLSFFLYLTSFFRFFSHFVFFYFLFSSLPRKLFTFVPFSRCFLFSLLDSFPFFSLNLSFRRVGDTVIPIYPFRFPLFVFFILIFSLFSDSCSVGRLIFLVFPFLFPYFLSKRLDLYFSFLSVLFFLYFSFDLYLRFFIFPLPGLIFLFFNLFMLFVCFFLIV